MGSLSPVAKMQFFDSNGNLLAGGKLYTYETGTTTPLATYTNSALSVANANPIILDARGEAIIYLQNAIYRYVLKDGVENTIWTRDGIVSDLYGAALGATVPLVVSNIAALEALTGMSNDAVAHTLGYYTDNDNGHGTYRYDSSSTATVNGGTAINAAGGAGRWLLIHSGIACAEQFGIVANGTNYASAITTATGLGLKIVFGKQNGEYCVSGSFNMLGDVDFINGARLKFIAESAITVDGDFRAGTLRVDANSYPVDLWAIYLKSGDHAIDVLHCENIKGDGRGAYATKVNFEGEGKVTRIGNLIGKQITDLINGARTGEEGFCGGFYATGPTNSTVSANCRTINIERGYGENIYTTQSDGVTENTSDYDSDFVRAFINEATSAAYLNTATINVRNIVTRGVQKRSVKISGCGNVVVSNAHGYGTRSGTQMSDIVFVADSRNVNITGTKGFLKFDNVIKLDGATFDGDYCVSDTQLYSSQANIGTGIYAANLVGLKVDGLLATTDCERLLRYDAVDRSETTGVKYNGTKTGTNPLLDIQNCDDLKLSYEVSAAFSGSTGQIVYIQGSNRATIDGIGAVTYAGAGGQNIRYNNCTYLTVTGYNESNKYNIFDEGTNTHVKFDQWVKQTGTNQSISITATDWLELNCSQLTGDFTGVNMTTGVVALSNIDHFKVTGIYQALNMTDASNDRGIVLTSCTRGTIDVETFTGASDPEMVRLSSCSKVYIKSISDSTKPVRILNTCTDIALQSFGPGAATNDAGAETTVINNVSTW